MYRRRIDRRSSRHDLFGGDRSYFADKDYRPGRYPYCCRKRYRLFCVWEVSALLKSIPAAVLGGIMLLLFGTIAAVGINSLIQNRTKLGDTRNLIIVSLILTFGIGGAAIEFGGFTMAGIGLSALLGVFLNLVLPKSKTLP